MSGNALGLSVSSPGGTVTVNTGTVTVTGAAPAPALDGGGTSPAGPAVTVGTQPDGTVTIVHTNGGPPATPDTPTVVGGPGTVTVGWDGLLASAAPLLDFLYVQVHLSAASGFTPSSATLQGTLPSPGGLYTIGSLSAGTTYYAKLVAYNKSMVASPASAQASGVPIVSGGAKVTVASTAPSSPVIGDLWYNSANGYQLEQWNGSTWSAYQFGTGAIAAGAVTATLLNGAVTARVIGGITTTISTTAPGAPLTGDIWVNTTLGVLEQWSGAAWVVITFNAVNAVQAGSITASLLNAAVTARVLGGITTTISTTAPGSPVTGDIWINTTNGVQEQWSGSAWVVITFNAANAIQAGTITATQIHAATITGSLIAAGTIAAGNLVANTITAGQIASGTITATQIQAATITGSLIAAGTIAASNIVANTITAGQIAASTITAAQLAANSVTSTQIAAGTITASDIASNTITAANLAAGIVVATIVDGTTITGASIVADGTSGEFLIYSGSPAAGNLIGSWSGGGGTDGHGNSYGTGLGLNNAAIPAQAGGQSLLFSDVHGMIRAMPGLAGDTDAYVLGHKLSKVPSPQVINSTTPVVLGNMEFAVGVGKYHIHGRVRATNGSSGTLQPQAILFNGSCSVSSIQVFVWSVAEQANTSTPAMAVGVITALAAGPNFDRTPALNENWNMMFDGIVTVTSQGTLAVEGSCVNSGSNVSWTAQTDSYWMLWPWV